MSPVVWPGCGTSAEWATWHPRARTWRTCLSYALPYDLNAGGRRKRRTVSLCVGCTCERSWGAVHIRVDPCLLTCTADSIYVLWGEVH